MPYIFTVFINLFIFLKLKNYQCFRFVRLRQNISTLAGETIDINKRLRYWALVCMSFRSACYSTFCPYVSPADVSQMGRGILPLPLTLKRDLESSPAIILSHQHLTCVTKIIFEEGENCAVYINLFFIS